MFGLFKSKKLENYLDETKKIKINGVIFRIKRIDAIDHMSGAKVLQMFYDKYQVNDAKKDHDISIKKVKEHYKDVLLAGIVSPKMCRKQDDKGFYIEKIFYDWDMATELYSSIMEFTYGKKKDSLHA